MRYVVEEKRPDNVRDGGRWQPIAASPLFTVASRLMACVVVNFRVRCRIVDTTLPNAPVLAYSDDSEEE